MIKTPVTVLQELMTKFGDIPQYECISQTGPHHQAVFEYRCAARGVEVRAAARSKKEAKQEAARRALAALAARGDPVPPPYRTAPAAPAAAAAPTAAAPALPSCSSAEGSSGAGEAEGGGGAAGAAGAAVDVRSYVALLKELCEEFKLGSVEYALVGDTGPPHLRRFTVRAALGRHERAATASTKKVARQLAAEQLYSYLRDHLADTTKDFVENRGSKVHTKTVTPENQETEIQETAVHDSPRKRNAAAEENQQAKRSCSLRALLQIHSQDTEDALSRALDKAMSRYVELREDQPWRPDLGQRVADYHLGLLTSISEEQRQAAREAERLGADEEPEEALRRLAGALGLTVETGSVAGERGPLSTVALAPAAPALVLAGRAPRDAAAAALRYLRRALRTRAAPAPAC